MAVHRKLPVICILCLEKRLTNGKNCVTIIMFRHSILKMSFIYFEKGKYHEEIFKFFIND